MKKLLIIPLVFLTCFCMAQLTGQKQVASKFERKETKTVFDKKYIDLSPRLNPKDKSPYMWFDLKPGIYKSLNCDLNTSYEWNRNSPNMGMAEMSLSELKNNKVISEFSTAEDNYEIIDGGLLLGNSKKLIITSEKSFLTNDGCIWVKK